MTTNPIVEFLASYGPQPSSNNLYDEFVVEAASRTGCAPIEISLPLASDLEASFRSDSARSVILTGTAGDGKTYTARKLAEALTEGGPIWSNTQKIFDVPAPAHPGRKIQFIKDLSELNDVDKAQIYPSIKASLLGQDGDLFVICVNDGHLLKFFRDRESPGDVLHDRIADMLRRDEQQDQDGQFRLINMSRQSHQVLVDMIISGVTDHDSWKGCEGCPYLNARENPCPIRLNLEILRESGPDSMRSRLKDIIRMSAADGRHLSIRQLILLTVNILLGDRKAGSALLTCQRARNRADQNQYDATNPYANAFGENLGERERFQYGAFAVLGEFGVGMETNNFFDHSLLWDSRALPSSEFYGGRIFGSHRERYRLDPSANAPAFRREMVDQRRRMFFSVDPWSDEVREDHRRDIWNLSVFKFGATYIRLAEALGEAGGSLHADIRRDLVRGLNRMMTGEMTTTDDRIWLTEPSGVYRGRAVPLLVQHAGSRAQGQTFVTFPTTDGSGKAPVLKLTPFGREELAVELVLRPTLVECLLRIANGALPSGFSSECRQDVERFQLRATAAVRDAAAPHIPPPQQIEMSEGKLQGRPIDIMVTEDEW